MLKTTTVRPLRGPLYGIFKHAATMLFFLCVRLQIDFGVLTVIYKIMDEIKIVY